jgi:hypothetical protein
MASKDRDLAGHWDVWRDAKASKQQLRTALYAALSIANERGRAAEKIAPLENALRDFIRSEIEDD